jgi:hypothetical protein
MTRKQPLVESLPLCDDAGTVMPPGPRVAQPVPDGLSKSRRETALKAQKIEMKMHPLVGLPLHPQAPADTDSKHRKPLPFTCGTCARLQQVPNIVRSELECMIAVSKAPARRWWPACKMYRQRGVVATTSEDGLID